MYVYVLRQPKQLTDAQMPNSDTLISIMFTVPEQVVDPLIDSVEYTFVH